jgi:AAA domain-containing protein
MSNTRHAPEGSPLRQERYCSSPAYGRGLMANLVAQRCSVLKSSEDRAVIWFVQILSGTEAGLDGLAAELLKRNPDKICTRSMREFGFKPGQKYNADQVRKVRSELHFATESMAVVEFPIDGDEREVGMEDLLDSMYQPPGGHDLRTGRRYPTSYPASVFVEACHRGAAKRLAGDLEELCLNPAAGLSGLWYFQDIDTALRDYRSAWIADHRSELVVTDLGARVEDTLNYALVSKGMVLIHGYARTGKTFSAKKWCALHPGIARFVEVPPGASDIGFFRAFAESLGVSINLNSKAHQLRDRIESVLFTGQQMVVLDESHRLWPESNYRDALPFRLSWIMMLANRGISVALITTQQFFKAQRRAEQRTGWASDQFQGRLLHTEALPDSLSKSDLQAVAIALLPEGDTKSIELLVTYAQASAKYLAGIEAVVKRARYQAAKEGRSRVSRSDIQQAIKGAVIPSDNALSHALKTSQGTKRQRGRNGDVETSLHGTFNGHETAPLQGAPGRPEFLASDSLTTERGRAAALAPFHG